MENGFVYIVRYRWIDLAGDWTTDGVCLTLAEAEDRAETIKCEVGAADRQLLAVQILSCAIQSTTGVK